MRSEDLGPRIPIPGAAGESIRASLQRLSTHCGEMGVAIQKQRVASGGYAYTVTVTQPPARPAHER